MLEDFHLIMLRVDQIDKCAHFYSNVLGLKHIMDDANWKTFELGKATLALRKWIPDTKDERPVKYGVSMGFHVQDVDATIDDLEEKGAHILVMPQDDDFGRYAKIVDPEGYIIMFFSDR